MRHARFKAALRAERERRQREQAGANIARKVVADYPATHNPYLLHSPMPDCFAGCKHRPD